MVVKLYSTPTCPYCHMAKDFLKEKKVEFEDINVATDVEGRNEMVEKTGQMGVPVILIDGEYIVGFDKDAIEDAIGKEAA